MAREIVRGECWRNYYCKVISTLRVEKLIFVLTMYCGKSPLKEILNYLSVYYTYLTGSCDVVVFKPFVIRTTKNRKTKKTFSEHNNPSECVNYYACLSCLHFYLTWFSTNDIRKEIYDLMRQAITLWGQSGKD